MDLARILHRQKDRRTDGLTDGRADKVIHIYPPKHCLRGGGGYQWGSLYPCVFSLCKITTNKHVFYSSHEMSFQLLVVNSQRHSSNIIKFPLFVMSEHRWCNPSRYVNSMSNNLNLFTINLYVADKGSFPRYNKMPIY